MGFFDFFQRILPKSFLNNAFTNWTGIYTAIGRQFDDLQTIIVNGQNQLFIDSATSDWALPIYEAEFAIKLVDQSNTDARRNNVMAMSRGGLGATPSSIQNVLKSYGYNTQINESFGTYTFTIQFTDTRGVPSNMNDLQALMTKLVPGHLKLQWQYIYTQYKELQSYTHQQMQAHTYQYYQSQLPT